MEIALKKIKILHGASEETFCYTADIYVDGKKAFAAQNHGHGGGDIYHRYPTYKDHTVEEVDAWLKANRPADTSHGITMAHCLEFEVGDLLNKHVTEGEIKKTRRAFEKLLATKICFFRDGALRSINLPPTAANLAAMRGRNPTAEVLNDASDDAKQRGLKAYAPHLF